MQPNLFTQPAEWFTRLRGSEFRITRLHDAPIEDVPMENPATVVDWLRPRLAQSVVYRPDVENLIIINLNVRLKPIGWEIIGTGSLNSVMIHPREIFKSAIIANAADFVLIHNHPSGDPTPSQDDVRGTRELIQVTQILKIGLIDHLILGRPSFTSRGWVSLKELGYFSPN